MKSLINGLKHGRLKDDKVRKGLFLCLFIVCRRKRIN
nr:MAG TPA: hypothetical protein [Caudoviricetes sp.]